VKTHTADTGNIERPASALVSVVCTQSLTVVGVPSTNHTILCSCKQQITIRVVLQVGNGTFVPFQCDRPLQKPQQFDQIGLNSQQIPFELLTMFVKVNQYRMTKQKSYQNKESVGLVFAAFASTRKIPLDWLNMGSDL
jgi:hypothetical protein